MSVPLSPPAFSALGSALSFIAGAWFGRPLGRLSERLAREAGLAPRPYWRRGPGLARLPIVGHFFAPKADRSGRGLALEIASGTAFLVCWMLFPASKAACGCIFLAGLIGASGIDLDYMIIPDLYSLGLALVGLTLSFFVPALHGFGGANLFTALHSGAAAVLGLALGSAFALWIALVGEWILDKEILGFGDIKLLGAIGAFCGWQGAVFSLMGGACLGAGALITVSIHRQLFPDAARPAPPAPSSGGEAARLGWSSPFPFGPMLAAAAVLYFFLLHPWVDQVLAPYRTLF